MCRHIWSMLDGKSFFKEHKSSLNSNYINEYCYNRITMFNYRSWYFVNVIWSLCASVKLILLSWIFASLRNVRERIDFEIDRMRQFVSLLFFFALISVKDRIKWIPVRNAFSSTFTSHWALMMMIFFLSEVTWM